MWVNKRCERGVLGVHVKGFCVNQHFPLTGVWAIMFLLRYILRRPLWKCASECHLPKNLSSLTSVCFFYVMCEVVVRGLWNLFHKAPLVGSSLWNTNGSFLRYSKWYKSGLIVQPLCYLYCFSLFFSSPLSCRAPIGPCMWFFFFSVYAKKIWVFLTLVKQKKRF